jgi:hypothetical protein
MRRTFRRVWLACACCGAVTGAAIEARSEELVAGPLVEPGAPSVPALPTNLAGQLLAGSGTISALRLEFFEPDLLRVAPVAGPGAAGSLCGPIFGSGAWSPCASDHGVPVAAIEVAPADIRFDFGNRTATLLSGSSHAELTWRLGLASHSAGTLSLGADLPSFEQELDLAPGLSWGELSVKATLLHSEWALEDFELCVPPDRIELGYAASTTLPALDAGARAAWALRGLGSAQPDWHAELGLDAPSDTGACLVRPQATLSLYGQDRQFRGSLRAAVEVTGELRAGQAFDLVLEYFSQEVVSGSLKPGDAPEHRVLLRLVF